ncbi:MAG: hypothetical protein PGN34_16695 [Methylobacterium frigidaeris]
MMRLLVGGAKAAIVIALMVIGVQAQGQGRRTATLAAEPAVTGALAPRKAAAPRLDQRALTRLVVGSGGAPAVAVKP